MARDAYYAITYYEGVTPLRPMKLYLPSKYATSKSLFWHMILQTLTGNFQYKTNYSCRIKSQTSDKACPLWPSYKYSSCPHFHVFLVKGKKLLSQRENVSWVEANSRGVKSNYRSLSFKPRAKRCGADVLDVECKLWLSEPHQQANLSHASNFVILENAPAEEGKPKGGETGKRLFDYSSR